MTAVPARLDGQEVAAGLHFPTSLTFDPEGVAYVAESGLPFDGAPPGGRIWRLDANGTRQLLADGLAPPVNGLTYHNGALWVSEAGPPGQISRHDHFFDRGGTSLSAVKLAITLNRAVSLKDLTRHPILADLAGLIDGRTRPAQAAQAVLGATKLPASS